MTSSARSSGVAEKEGFESYMVTPDKDFGQLVSAKTFMFKPSRMGEGIEVLGLPEVLLKWGIERPEQVIDVLALWGDISDNIPGVPGIGEKTAIKLIAQYGSVENLLAHTDELKGKLKENLETHRAHALLSKKLATIICDAPCPTDLGALAVKPRDDEKIKQLFVEFEFNSLGRRLFGDDFRAGRGFAPPTLSAESEDNVIAEMALASETEEIVPAPSAPVAQDNLKTLADVPHQYHIVAGPDARKKLIKTLQGLKSFCFHAETAGGADPKQARLVGFAFSFEAHTGHYVPVPADAAEAAAILEEFRPVFEDEHIEKVGHNLKFDLSVLKWRGLTVRGKLFDTLIAHSLVEPDLRHGMDYLADACLGYAPTPVTGPANGVKAGQISLGRRRAGNGRRIRHRIRRCYLAASREARTVAEGQGPGTGVL